MRTDEWRTRAWRQGTGRRRGIGLGLAALVAVACSAASAAQNEPFVKTVPFAIDTRAPLEATVGPVKIASVQVANLGRGYGRGGISLRRVNPASELSTTLRIDFAVDNPTREEWDVTFQVELLDKAGKVIDRTSREENYEDEQDVLEIEHGILEYVLPLISNVRVTLTGKRS